MPKLSDDTKQKLIEIGSAVLISLAVYMISHFSIYERLELMSLDVRYNLRPPISMNSDLATVDIDDHALKDEGRWQDWTRDKHARLIEIIRRAGGALLGFDVYFPEESEKILRPPDIKRAGSVEEVFAAFRDYDKELAESARKAGNVYISSTFTLEEEQESEGSDSQKPDKGLISSRALAWENLGHLIEAGYAIYAGERDVSSILRAKNPDAPPIPILSKAVHGVGFAQITKETDGVVRKYPTLIQFDYPPGEKDAQTYLLPSIPLAMACNYLQVPIKKMKVAPGEYLELPNAYMPDGAQRDIRIPITEKGEMIINWAGDYKETFRHFPYSSLMRLADQQTLTKIKKAAAAQDPSIFQAAPDELHKAVASALPPTRNLATYVGYIYRAHRFERLIEAARSDDLDPYILQSFFGLSPEDDPATYAAQKDVFSNVRLNCAMLNLISETPSISVSEAAEKLGVSEGEAEESYATINLLVDEGGPEVADLPLCFMPPATMNRERLLIGKIKEFLAAQDPSIFQRPDKLLAAVGGEFPDAQGAVDCATNIYGAYWYEKLISEGQAEEFNPSIFQQLFGVSVEDSPDFFMAQEEVFDNVWLHHTTLGLLSETPEISLSEAAENLGIPEATIRTSYIIMRLLLNKGGPSDKDRPLYFPIQAAQSMNGIKKFVSMQDPTIFLRFGELLASVTEAFPYIPDAGAYVEVIYGAHWYEALIRQNQTGQLHPSIFAALFGVRPEGDAALYSDQKGVFRNVWLHHTVLGLLTETPHMTVTEAAEKLGLSEEDVEDSYTTIRRLISEGGVIAEDRPLFFLQPVEVDGRALSLEDLRGGVFFYGLTATGTHDFNPMPFSPRYPMVGSLVNVFNTIVTDQFITRMPSSWRLPLLLAVGLFAGLIMSQSTAIRGSVFMIMFLFAYLLFSYWVFVNRRLWIDVVGPAGIVLLSDAVVVWYKFHTAEKKRKFIRGAFEHYMNPAVVKQITENPDMLELGGQEMELTAFFSDVAGFTSISEQLTPHELVELLNEYLTEMTDIVLDYEGLLDKYEGDAVMAVFGAPIHFEDHATKACFAALEMQEKLEEMRKTWKADGRPELQARIGLNTGSMIVGNMGSRTRFDYTVMGDAVNLASHLEGVNKQYGTFIMISEFTLALCESDIIVRELDLIRVKGKLEPVRIYEVLARANDGISDEMKSVVEHFTSGLEAYRNQGWEKGVAEFQAVLDIRPDDGPSQTYLARCKEYKEAPPPDDWDGVYVMTTK